MKKSIFLVVLVFMVMGLLSQTYEFPEEVQERLNKEPLDLTVSKDFIEVDLSEESYYEYVYREYGTDTILGYKWNKMNQQWELRARIIKIYNDNEQVIEKFFQHLRPNHQWINGLHYVFVYDGYGNRTEKTIQYWHRFNQQWVNYFHRYNVFNTSNQLIEATTQRWSVDSSQWINRHYRILIYKDELLQVDTSYHWRLMAGLWAYHHMNHYHYDSLGKLKARLVHHWRVAVQAWIKEHRGLFHYNQQGYLSAALRQDWNPFTMNWKNKYRHFFNYDDQGNRIYTLKQLFITHTQTWDGVEMKLFTYNLSNKLSVAVFKHKRPWHLTWHNKKKLHFEYDNEGNMIKKLVRHWSEFFQEWYNFRLWKMVIDYKSAFSATNEPHNTNTINLMFGNPYHPGSPMKISGLEDGYYRLELFNLSGRLVDSRTFESEQTISIGGNSPAGMYLLGLYHEKELLLREKMVIAK